MSDIDRTIPLYDAMVRAAEGSITLERGSTAAALADAEAVILYSTDSMDVEHFYQGEPLRARCLAAAGQTRLAISVA